MSKHRNSKTRAKSNSRGGDRPAAGVDSADAPRPTLRDDLRQDAGFTAIVAFLAAIALWLLLMPWAPGITSAAIRRFHLGSSSFLVWAAQFPIPSMYNFANRYEVDRYPPGLVDPLFDESEKRYINHFPARCITFADGRYTHLREQQDRWITMETSYRGRELETRFHVKAKPGGGFELIRLPSPEAKR